MAGILQIIEGAAEIAVGALIIVGTLGGGAPLGAAIIAAGVGTVISGVGSLIQGNPLQGFATTVKNPITPWRVVYGRARVGGALVYQHSWGANNQMLDLVIVLAAHTCDAVEELLFDQQRIQIDTSAKPAGAPAAAGTSFTPVQQTVNITSIGRNAQGVVTVVLPNDIPYLDEGDQVLIENVPGDTTLNGTVQVAQIVEAPGTHIGGAIGAGVHLKFTFLSGGVVSTVATAGQVKTRWADYGRNVYFEPILGAQTLGQTFVGMQSGTPWQGSGPLTRPELPGLAGEAAQPTNIFGGERNQWTNFCSLQGKTAVFVRLKFDQKYFAAGLPQISFHVRGKNDIFDPRGGGGAGSTGYTENSALCIADFLSNTTFGFKAPYSTEIPLDRLSAAADVCDQAVTLANGSTEPRYACNGQFELTQRRGSVLQDMLTSCAGRLTYVGGQFAVQPGYWVGPGTPPLAVNLTAIAAGRYEWRAAVSIRDLYNGCKGTYISPSNKWQSTDFPYYAQDSQHGYSGPSLYGGDILLAADGGDRRWLELHLPFTISASMAQRIAKIELLRRRGREGQMVGAVASAGLCGTGTFPLNMAGYQFLPLDIFEATVPFLGFTDKLLEITAVRLRMDEDTSGGAKAVRLGTEIDVQETDSSIYVWSTSEELTPQGYVQGRSLVGTFSETAPLPWSPGYASPLPGDGICGAASFGIETVYGMDAQGNATAALEIKGTPPINALDTGVAAPQIVCAPSNTGGALPPGNYVVALTAYDSGSANYANTDYLNVPVVAVGGSGAGSIAVAITWGSGDDGGDLYLGTWSPAGLVFHFNQTLAPGAASAAVTGNELAPQSWESSAGGPDPLFDHFGVAWQEVIHGGAWAQQVASRTTTTITFGGSGMTLNQWSGYILTLLAKVDFTVEIPLLNIPIASSTASSGGLFTVTLGPGPDGNTLPDLTTLLAVGDLLECRMRPTFTASGFSDPNIANGFYPAGATAVETGHVAVVMTGPDAGDVQTISTVTVDGGGHFTNVNLAGQWAVTPNTGDIVVICAPASAPEAKTAALSVRNKSVTGVVATVSVANLAGQVWLFRVRTEDGNGKFGYDSVAPVREVYFFGAQGTRTITSATTGGMLLTDRVLKFDTSGVTGSTTTLSGNINSSVTAITLAISYTAPNGTVLQIGTELMYVQSGSGTANLTVARGWAGSTAASHTSGDTVNVPGALTWNLIAYASVPNQDFLFAKSSTDINYVKLVPQGSDQLPDNEAFHILADTSASFGTYGFTVPAQ